MRNIFTVTAIMLAAFALPASAYDSTYSGCIRSIILNYTTVNQYNQPTVMSERVTLPLATDRQTAREIKFIVLNSPSMVHNDKLAPTGDENMAMGLMSRIATDGAMVVEPDGMGFNANRGNNEGLMLHSIAARNMVDGLLAALDYVATEGLPISADYYTLSTGYSKGGSMAIAVQRYLERIATPEQLQRIHFRKTICGGGALVPLYLFLGTAQYAASPGATTNYALMSMIEGIKAIYDEGCMHAISMEDIFTEKCLTSGILDKINSRVFTDGEISQKMVEYFGTTAPPMYDIFKPEVFDGQSAVYRAIYKAWDKSDLTADGWVPETQIEYMHLTDDISVPYACAQTAQALWGDKLHMMSTDMDDYDWNCAPLKELTTFLLDKLPIGNHLSGGFKYFSGMMDGCMRGEKIPSTYANADNLQAMLQVMYDLLSDVVYTNINVNTYLDDAKKQHFVGVLDVEKNYTFHLKGTLTDDDDTVNLDIRIVLTPSATEQNHIELLIDFDIDIPDTKVRLTGTSTDIVRFAEALSAIILHPTFSSKADAQKYATAANKYLKCTVTAMSYIDADIYMGVTSTKTGGSLFNPTYTYSVEPKFKWLLIEHNLSEIIDLEKEIGLDGSKTTTLTLDDDYVAAFRVTERKNNQLTLHIDITGNGTGTDIADIDAVFMPETITGADATLNTSRFYFDTVLIGKDTVLKGSCSSLHDALVAVIMTATSKHFASEAAAQEYADHLNTLIKCDVYVSGNYTGRYGCKVSGPDAFGNYYVDASSAIIQ